MLEKKPIHLIKIANIAGGSATPGPPIGPKVGSKGLKAIDICNDFNARTKDRKGEKFSIVISVYEDKTFNLVIKNPPVAELIKKVLGLKSGSGEPNRKKIGVLNQDQLKQIALLKKEESTAFDLNAVINTIIGTARSMGVTISE